MATLDGNFVQNVSMPAPYQNGEWNGIFGNEFFANRNAENEYFRNMQQTQYNARLTEELNKQLFEQQKELRQTQYQDLVKSARAAGINPIFALGTQNSVSASGSSSVSSGSYSPKKSETGGQLFSFLGQIISGLITNNGMLSAAAMKSKSAIDVAKMRQVGVQTLLPHKNGGYSIYRDFNKK